MAMHRLFVALRLPADLLQACLKAAGDVPPGWAAQDAEQLHVTLRFIGEVDRHRAEDIAAMFGSIRAPALWLALAGVGWFDHGPRGALFARVEPREPLAALHAKLDRALIRLGEQPEGRSYLPHITLARRRAGAADPARWLERHSDLATPATFVRAMTLFESHLGRDGPTYETVDAYPFG